MNAPLRGTFEHELTSIPTIDWVHEKLRTAWGSASEYPCIECGKRARDWAYDETDPEYLIGSGRRYSKWPEFYMPMCRKCHSARDGAIQRAELRAVRNFMYKCGLSLADIEALDKEIIDVPFPAVHFREIDGGIEHVA